MESTVVTQVRHLYGKYYLVVQMWLEYLKGMGINGMLIQATILV